MKKINLIIPILTTSGIVGMVAPLASCSCGGNPTTDDKVKVEYDLAGSYKEFYADEPKVDETFNFSITVLENYAVNYAESKIIIGGVEHSLNNQKIGIAESSNISGTYVYFTVYPELMKNTEVKIVFSTFELNKFTISGSHNVDWSDSSTWTFTCSNPNVTWSIDDSSVATINDGGIIPNANCVNRSATITATSNENTKQIARFDIELGSFSKLNFTASSMMPDFDEYSCINASTTNGVIIIPTRRYIDSTNEWRPCMHSKSEGAFQGCTELLSVNFPMSTSVGGTIMLNKNDFKGCSKLETINWDAIAGLNASAFEGCSKLNNVKLNNLLNDSIEQSCFKDCVGLTSLEIGKTIDAIQGSAFEGCSGLTNVTIPFNVVNIGQNAFYNSGITSATFENSDAKWLCGSNEVSVNTPATNAGYLKTENTTMSLKDSNISYLTYQTTGEPKVSVKAKEGATMPTNLVIPKYLYINNVQNSIESILTDGFKNCANITSLDFYADNCTINSGAFANCSQLQSVNFYEAPLSLEENAFANCTGINEIYIPSGINLVTIDNTSKLFSNSGASVYINIFNTSLSEECWLYKHLQYVETEGLYSKYLIN